MFKYLFAAACLLAVMHIHSTEKPCVTDSECFIQCEREKGRPCTDEDVFGPSENEEIQGEDGPCQDLPLDHPDYCEE